MTNFVIVRTPVDLTHIEKTLAEAGTIQFDEPLTESEYRMLAEYLQAHPKVTLRVYGTNPKLADLSFLSFFPHLRRFSVDGLDFLADLRPLKHLSENLQSLDLGETQKALDLTPATRFSQLAELRVIGHRKGLGELIDRNSALRALALWRLPVDSVLPTADLPQLESLAITLGSVKDLKWITRFRNLRYLAIRGVRGVVDLNALRQLERLEWLWLESLGKVAQLPDFAESRALLRVELTSLKGLTSKDSLQPLARAPRLREVLVTESSLPPEAFAPLAEHTSLKRAGVGLGTERKNKQAEAILARPVHSPAEDFASTHSIIRVL